VQGPPTVQLDHTFTGSGAFTVLLTVTDKDGGASVPASQTIAISAVEMQGNTLAIGGTLNGDTISIIPTGPKSTTVQVIVNGVSQGSNFLPTEQILVFAQAGDDTVQFRTAKIKGSTVYVTCSALVFAGAGNDTVDARGSSGDNAILGGDGNDVLWGGIDRDILIGGLGADTLHGGDDDDILIGGTTDFDTNLAALSSLIAEWRRLDLTYQPRLDHLTGVVPGGLNGGNLLTPLTVHDDAAVDQLYGDNGQDWFFYQANGSFADVLADRKQNEQATPI
jgi:Ca2+-binding RTX toxin-like protein